MNFGAWDWIDDIGKGFDEPGKNEPEEEEEYEEPEGEQEKESED